MDQIRTLKGSISIFLILVLVPLYTCIYLTVGSVRYSAGRSRLLGILNLNGNSALNHYELTLKRQFDLFSMGEPEEKLQQKLEAQYLEMIVPENSGVLESKNVVTVNPDTYQVHYPDQSILARPEILEKTISDYMKERAPVLFARELGKKSGSILKLSKETTSPNLPPEKTAVWKKPEIQFLSQNLVPSLSGKELVEQEFGGLKKVSGQNAGSWIQLNDASVITLVGAERASKIDSYAAVSALSPNAAVDNDEKALKSAGKSLFQMMQKTVGKTQLELEEYMAHMFSCYTTGNEEQSLTEKSFGARRMFQGELEYLLFGADSKRANVILAAQSILAIRVYINGLYAYCSPKMQAQALEAVGPLVELTGGAAAPLAEAVIAMWVLAESVNDVQSLLKGGAVPFYKTDATWRTSITGSAVSNTVSSTDLTYKDYLRLFLFGKTASESTRRAVLSRCAKLMQAACVESDSRFDITLCYQQVELKARIVTMGYPVERKEVYSY